MKIISFVAIKGGVGKTTLTFNYGEWLAKQGKKVLFIDLDHQCNLTQTYELYDTEQTIANVFKGGEVAIKQVKDNIAIIPGYMQLDLVERELENNDRKNMMLYLWLEDNYEKRDLEQYDYVLIDCHPDFSIATKNAIAVSHAIISPLIPSEFGYNAKFNLESRLEAYRKDVIDYRTRESYITADLYFLANMIRPNYGTSRELLEALEQEASEKGESDLIGVIPAKELFNHSTIEKISIAEMKEDSVLYHKHKKFFDEIDLTFSILHDTI
ncbi:ParA family protein [Streptococcus ovuberis]|uniref:AAA family ATPase n=1 Tax=Streptococcus ovuberis TaxID=1936207 RepID=A0A7X6RZZ5_9STRE|nr:AAA family ATPase [Streptococcus ovuberis]NKZ19683.1 AAA family ATPase [Streptococcus ovuberis]